MSRSIIKGLIIGLLLLSTMAGSIPVDGQLTVTIDIEVIQDFVNVTVSETEDRTLIVDGKVTVTKPPSPLIIVDVSLSSAVNGNFTSSIEPETMEFTSTGTEYFTLTVVVPAGTENITNATATVQGFATASGFPTVEDHDDVLIIVEYPIEPEKPENPRPPDAPITSMHAGYYCLISILIGLGVGGLLYWKRKRAGPREKEVVYRPRRKVTVRKDEKNNVDPDSEE
jgi:hypothetical protein